MFENIQTHLHMKITNLFWFIVCALSNLRYIYTSLHGFTAHILVIITFELSTNCAFIHLHYLLTLSYSFSLSKLMPEITESHTGHRWQYSECELHAGYISLQTHTHNIWHLLFFHYINGCTNTHRCNAISSLPVLLWIHTSWVMSSTQIN